MAKKWWGSHPFPGEDPVCWNFGPLQLWCKSTADELWITFQHKETSNGGKDRGEASPVIPGTPEWRRWTLRQSYKEIQVLPAFPDLPVVVKPESPFRVTRDVRTRIYVRVPVWVKILLGKTGIVEIPAIVLSKTWFGNFTDGELCYWISSSARKKMEPDPSRPFLAICPIQIINRSEDELPVEKICLRVNQLAMYSARNQLWGNETRVIYKGQNESSEIEISHKAPPEAPEAKLISSSRETSKKGFTAKTFASLMDLPGLGFLQK